MFYVGCRITNFIYLNTKIDREVEILIGNLRNGVLEGMTDQQIEELREFIDSVPNFVDVSLASERIDDHVDLYDSIREGKALPDLIDFNSKHFQLISSNEKPYSFDFLSFHPVGVTIHENDLK